VVGVMLTVRMEIVTMRHAGGAGQSVGVKHCAHEMSLSGDSAAAACFAG